jgi:hypothetical protein
MHKHHVKFMAEKPVKEPVTVAFRTKDGEPVSFNAHKVVNEEVEVDFMARNK